MVGAARAQAALHPGLTVVVPIASGLDAGLVRPAFAGSGLDVAFIEGRAAEVVGACDVAAVASGTATLEAALMQRVYVTGVGVVSSLGYGREAFLEASVAGRSAARGSPCWRS